MTRPAPEVGRPSDPGSDPELVARIAATIERDGPITFARFMEMALYDPDHGYYRAAAARPGRAGDFLTAPETSPIFGQAVARQLDEMWARLGRPDPFVVREYGAGTGALALSVLDGLRADGSDLLGAVRWDPVEVEPRRTAALAERLAKAGFAGAVAAVPGRRASVVIANEFLDALPVHRVTVRGGELREILVGRDGDAFVDVIAEPTTPALAARLSAEGVTLAEGQRAEICLALEPWIAEVAAALDPGYAIFVDYGHPAAELYGPARAEGTLRAYVRHTVHADPYRNVGRQDLTAHVDLTALERAARAAGLEVVGRTTQAEFLVGCGGDELLERARAAAATPEAWLELRSGLRRLLDPRATGAFRVVVLARGVPPGPQLRGLSFRLRPDDPS